MAGVGKGAGTGGVSQGTSVENQLFPRHFSFSSVLLGDGVPGWPPCSKPFIHFPITHPSSLLPASSDAAINIPPAFHRSREMHIADKRDLRWQYERAFRPALVKWLTAGSSALSWEVWGCWVACFRFLEEWNILLVIMLTSGLGYMGLFLRKLFLPINNVLHMVQSWQLKEFWYLGECRVGKRWN